MTDRTSAKKRKTDEARTHSETHYHEEGNLEIVSSDGVVFRVHAFHLQASSKVFRDMIEIGDPHAPKVIELDDSVIETAEVVTAVFDLIIDNRSLFDNSVQLDNSIILFLQKYDCERELFHIRASIGLRLGEKRASMRAFTAAARIGDIQLCGRAIAEAGTRKWTKLEGGERFGFRNFGGPIFEVGGIPLVIMECLAPPVLWALVCASSKRTGLKEKIEEDNKAMSEEFMRLMQLKDAPKYP